MSAVKEITYKEKLNRLIDDPVTKEKFIEILSDGFERGYLVSERTIDTIYYKLFEEEE